MTNYGPRADFVTPDNWQELLQSEISLDNAFLNANSGDQKALIGRLRTIRERQKQIQTAMQNRQSGAAPLSEPMERAAGTGIINMDAASAQLRGIGEVINAYEGQLASLGLTLESVREQTV